MARTDNDTWDLASGVGATATMVAAARAIATKAENPLIDDRFADPLVRAVGVDFFTRWATGELDAADLDDSESVVAAGAHARRDGCPALAISTRSSSTPPRPVSARR